MKVAVLFPGQGSQYLGMGQEFVQTSQSCAEVITQAESVCDFNLRHLSFEGPMEELTRASYLQPAITTANLICLQAFREKMPNNIEIAGYAGHSLGEYSALCAAGVLSVIDTIRLVERRGYFMEREGEKNPGGMRAILGLSINEIEAVINAYEGDGEVTVANYNTPQQIVISGDFGALDRVSSTFEEQGAKVIALNVSVANHSPLVQGAIPDYAEFMATIPFLKPEIPVYFNVSGAPQDNPDEIRAMMERQIASRVKWYELISRMLDAGIDTFIEVGPKTVLKGMMRKIVPKGVKVNSMQFDTPETLDKCLEKLSSLS
ncbi:MAG: [acyl-carrier-protein] S-malonyltransferase [Desulfobulbaceae bacterium]|nr:MAG: [acyl-carrier-protein] S-malonyltransferase [Desulfobulbaceae bacterium]